MQLVARENYYKLIEPLKQVTINNLFARSVIEQKISGKIYVDDIDNPQTFYVIHPYGMSFLFGKNDNEIFNQAFRDRILDKPEWMQAFPASWDEVLAKLFEGSTKVELNTRVNFKFDKEKFLQRTMTSPDADITIVQTNRQLFRDMKGSVVPLYFWESEEEFIRHGVGFSLLYKDQLASTAYSSFIHDDQLELGIETIEEFRGKGFAQLVCAVLINYCIANNYEPVWSCRLENTGSYLLAQKLGFVPLLTVPYYRLMI